MPMVGMLMVIPIAFALVGEWRAHRSGLRILVPATAVATFAMLFMAPQVLSLAAILPETARAAMPLGPASARVTASPEALWGTPAAAAAIASQTARWAGALVMIGATLRLGRPAAEWTVTILIIALVLRVADPYLADLPWYSTIRSTAILWRLLLPLYVAGLAGAGWDALRSWHTLPRWRLAFGVLAAVVLLQLEHRQSGVTITAGAAVTLALAAPWLPTAATDGLGVAAAGGVLLLAVEQLANWGTPLLPYPPYDPSAQMAIVRRLAGHGRAFAPILSLRGHLMAGEVPEVDGHDGSLPPARVTALLDRAGIGYASVWAGHIPDRAALAAHRNVLDLLGVTVLGFPDGAENVPLPGFRRSGRAGLVALQRSDTVESRAVVVHRVYATTDPDEELAAVSAPRFAATQEAVVEADAAPAVTETDEPSQIAFLADAPEQVTIQTSTGAPGLLVLADTWASGWAATLDDRPVPILRADYAFRGVAVPAGRHVVDFRYRPAAVWWGFGLAFTGAVVALVAGRERLPGR